VRQDTMCDRTPFTLVRPSLAETKRGATPPPAMPASTRACAGAGNRTDEFCGPAADVVVLWIRRSQLEGIHQIIVLAR
jgi:hypothetical protein